MNPLFPTEDAVLFRSNGTRLFLAACSIAALSLVGCTSMGEYVTYSVQSRSEGVKLMEAGNDEAALGAFSDAAKQNPRDYQSRYFLGVLHAKNKREQFANESFLTSLLVAPETAEGRNDAAFRTRTANAYADFLSTASAREIFLNTLEEKARERNQPGLWQTLARTYELRGDADLAIEAYDRAVLVAPGDFDIHKSSALYLLALKQNTRADARLRRAYQLNQNDEEVLAGLRQLNIVPGPSLLTENQLAKPIMPKGPLPEVEINVRDSTPRSTSTSTTP
jgi:Tfp pilus assembly protein PilF